MLLRFFFFFSFSHGTTQADPFFLVTGQKQQQKLPNEINRGTFGVATGNLDFTGKHYYKNKGLKACMVITANHIIGRTDPVSLLIDNIWMNV